MISLRNFRIAILVLGYSRPELLSSRLIELCTMGAQNVFVSVDGPKELDPFTPQIEECQRIANEFGSEHSYSVTIQDNNLGLSRHVTQSITSVLLEFDWVIVIEDDIKLSPRTLESFKAGIRLSESHGLRGTVGGFSFYGNSKIPFLNQVNCWRTSDYFSAWGWAVSKTCWEKYNLQINSSEISSSLAKSKVWNTLNSRQQASWISKFEKVSKDPLFTWDFQMVYTSFVNDWTHLLPIFRFVDNEGFGDTRGTHTKGERPANLLGASNSGSMRNKLLKNRYFKMFFSTLDSKSWILDDPSTINNLMHLGKVRKLFTKR